MEIKVKKEVDVLMGEEEFVIALIDANNETQGLLFNKIGKRFKDAGWNPFEIQTQLCYIVEALDDDGMFLIKELSKFIEE